VYVREDTVLPRLDAWLGRLFDPANLDATVAALAAVNGDDTTAAKIERCRRALVDCEQRLARYRAALEAGTDPNVIAQWTAEVQAEHAQAEHDLRIAQEAHEPPASREELEALIRDADDLVTVLTRTDASDRAALYAALGLRLSYQPDERRVVVECPGRPTFGQRFVSADRCHQTARAPTGGCSHGAEGAAAVPSVTAHHRV